MTCQHDSGSMGQTVRCTKSQQRDFLQSSKNDVTVKGTASKDSNKNERTRKRQIKKTSKRRNTENKVNRK